MATQLWQVKVAESVSGILFLGARKNGRGPWLSADEVSQPLRDYIFLKPLPGAAGHVVLDIEEKRLDDLEKLIGAVGDDRFGRREGTQAYIWVTVEKPDKPPKPRKIPRNVPAIRSLQDLIDHFGADDVTRLNRRIYKDTSSGASISVQTPDGEWHHNGQDWAGIDEIIAFTIQTIVEGSDATVDSDAFVLPVTAEEVDNWIADMESEADTLWHEANDPIDEGEGEGEGNEGEPPPTPRRREWDPRE